jgi:alpha-galactosidase
VEGAPESAILIFRKEAQMITTGKRTLLFLATAMLLSAGGCQQKAQQPAQTPASGIQVKSAGDGIRFQTSAAQFVLNASGYLSAGLRNANGNLTLDQPDPEAGQGITIAARKESAHDFKFDLEHASISDTSGKLGSTGKRVEVRGTSSSTGLSETLTVEVYDSFPRMALLSATLRNDTQKDVELEGVWLQRHRLNAKLATPGAAPHEMWSFHGSSLKWGKDDVFPIPAKFSQENPFGAPVATKDDLGEVGGGIPVVALWTRTVGEAIGHIETLPLAVSIPIATDRDGLVDVAVKVSANAPLKTGEVFSTPRTFVAVYSGDYYEPLKMWSDAVEREGLARPENNEENYAVSWCGWGYESDVTPAQMIATIPKLKEMSIHWATLDDRWFNNYGDWQPRTDTFPGDAISTMVQGFHDHGIKVQIWWLPLGVEDRRNSFGARNYVTPQVLKEHPDWLVLGKDGKPARMARNLATLCPAVPEVQAYYKQLTERFIRDWGFDGHKLDNIYTVPPCYNPKHHHKSPTDSVYAMGEVYKIIFQTTRALKPNSVTQSCPCGTPPSMAWLRYMDQAVTADPVGSVQVRRRIKMYKALLGPRAAVYGDHVELTRISGAFSDKEQDIGRDFASTLGTGGVLGTKFTWPEQGSKFKTVDLTPEKDAYWKKWISLYNEKMLSKGNFLDLYNLGYDVPEGYAIEKDGSMYYAFYAPDQPSGPHGATAGAGEWSGTIELRGLEGKTYYVTDYVNGKDYGTVTGPLGTVKVTFTDSLLLQASPEKAASGGR